VVVVLQPLAVLGAILVVLVVLVQVRQLQVQVLRVPVAVVAGLTRVLLVVAQVVPVAQEVVAMAWTRAARHRSERQTPVVVAVVATGIAVTALMVVPV